MSATLKSSPDDCIRGGSRPSATEGKLHNGGFGGEAPGQGRGSEGRSPPEADNIFLFQRLLSLQNYHINLGYLYRLHSERGSTSSPAYNQIIMVRRVRCLTEGLYPSEAVDIFLFQRLTS